MKNILLKPVSIYFNHALVDVYDYPNEDDKETLRKRLSIDVEYSSFDIDILKKDNPNLTIDDALEHYRSHIYDMVKVRILDDWQETEGLEETLEIVRENISKYFE